MGYGFGFRDKSLRLTHNFLVDLLKIELLRLSILDRDLRCRWLIDSLIVGLGHILVFVLSIVDELIIRVDLLIGSSVKPVLHFLLWHVHVLLRDVVFHHVISCSGGTRLLVVFEHAFVVGELDAANVVIEINVDIVVVGWVGRGRHLHAVFSDWRVERSEACCGGHGWYYEGARPGDGWES